MWWYGYGWWWWWLSFVLIFVLLPLGYGWGYRGWGPWYRRRHTSEGPPEEHVDDWGLISIFLWFTLLISFIWLIAAWGWGTW